MRGERGRGRGDDLVGGRGAPGDALGEREPGRHEPHVARRRRRKATPFPKRRIRASPPALIGHPRPRRTMLAAYREERLAHAWLIGGREGDRQGDARLALRALRAGQSRSGARRRSARRATSRSRPSHPAARHLAALSHPDFALVRREWNAKAKTYFSEIRVEDVRAAVSMFHLSAAFGGWRVAIVDCADELNRAGANALLKIIEEPPPRSLFLIVAHRPGRVLPTIRSRCRRLLLEPPDAGRDRSDRSPALARRGTRSTPPGVGASCGARRRLGARGAAPARSRRAGPRRADRRGDRRIA